MAQTSVPSVNARRRRRIERQLRALYAMQSHMRTRDILWSLLAFPLLALLCFGVAWKLHLASGSLPTAIALAAAFGGLIWLIGRRWLTLAWLIIAALLMILFEDIPDFWSGGETDKPERQTLRQMKLERAIARREAMLRALDGP